MARRTTNDGGTAVIDRKGDPDLIAARVAAAEAEARREAATADVNEWRRIVSAIADGQEPDGKTLAAIGDLCRRLRLPADAVAASVSAIREERRLQAECDSVRDRITSMKDREAEIATEVKAVEARLLALREEIAEHHGLHAGYPHLAVAVARVRNENPVLFADAAHVADRLTAAEAGIGTDVFKSMVPQQPHLDSCSRGTWGG